MLITLNNNFLRSGFSLPASAVDGKSKFAASVWVYWVNRTTTDYKQVIGELVAGTTTSFTLIRYADGYIQCTLAINNGGLIQRASVFTHDYGATGGTWHHLFFTYEASTGLLNLYVDGSGSVQNTTNVGGTGRNLWTTSADRPVVTFLNNADEWQMGETVIWMGSSIPALADIQGYYGNTVDMDTICAGVAPVMRYENIQDPTVTVDGAAEYVEDSSGNAYHLVWTAGSATIDNVVAGTTPIIEPFASEVTTSGELIKVSFRNIVSSSTSIIVDRSAGTISLRRKAGGIGAWSAAEDCIYYSRRGSSGAGSNALWIVVPTDLRATGSDDTFELTLNASAAIIDGTSQWSSESVLTPTNSYGVVQHTLPDVVVRKPVNSSLGAFGATDGFLRFSDVLGDSGAWNGVETYTADGLPATLLGGYSFAFTPVFGDFHPAYSGTTHLLWRGSPASVPKLLNGSSVELSLTQTQDTITKDAQSWNRRTYSVVGTGCLFAIYADGGGDFNLTDIAAIRDEQLTAWQAGEIADSEWSSRTKWFTSLRWMDAMKAVNCNAWNESHFLSSSYAFPKRSQDNSSTESQTVHTVTAQESYTGDGYFFDGVILKLTLSGNHSQLKTGQRCSLSGFTVDGAGAPSTVTVSIDTDNAGLAANEVVVRVGSAGTHSGSGTLTVTINSLPPAWAIAGLQNAAYAEGGKSNACWICRPHACTDASWEQWVGELDSELNAGIEIWVEYSNEVWNSAFQGQWRHNEGMAQRNGATNGNDQYAASSYSTYKITKDSAVSGRVVRLIIAGQSVTSSVVSSRMGYLQSRYTADTDPSKPASWAAFNVIMSTSNYFDWLSSSGLTASAFQCNRDAVVNLTPNGVIDLADLGYRDLSSYVAIKATYGKNLWAYEGGPNWDIPDEESDDFTAVTRAMFAASHHPRMANAMWGAWEAYVTVGGFDGVSCGTHEGDWSEITGKNWSNVKSWGQVSGAGDGTDGLYDNVSNLATYIANGDTDPVWDNLVSTRAHAVEQWSSGDGTPQYVVLGFGGQYMFLEMAGG